MKQFFFCLSIAMVFLAAAAKAQTVKLLLLMPDKYGANYFLDRDDFENFGWDVTTAGVSATVIPCQDYAGPLGCPVITVDTLVSEIDDISGFDILVVSSGGGGNNSCANLVNNPATLQMIRNAADSGITIGAMCSGVRVLAASGVLNGIHITSNLRDSVYCTSRGAIHNGVCGFPVIDGQFVTTSIGDYYHHQNTEAVMRAFSEIMKNKMKNKETPRLVMLPFVPETQSLISDTVRILTYGGTLADGGRSLTRTSDGGLLISGFTFSSGQGYADAFLMKTDAGGNLIWSNTTGGPLHDYSNSATETSNGYYLSCGYTYSAGAGSADVMVIKSDSLGRTIWSKTYGGAGFETGQSLLEASDGKYLVCGYTESYGNGKDDVWLIKLDTAGNMIWKKTFGGTESEMGKNLIESSDGNLLIAGSAGNISPNPGYGWWGDRDAMLIKTDTAGNLIWDKRYNTQQFQQWGNSVAETGSHHLLIAGSNDITGSELQDVYFIKADSSGIKKMTKSFGEGTFYEYGNAIIQDTDEKFLICGTTKSISGGNDLYLLTVNTSGALLSKKIIGGEGNDWGNAVTSMDGKISVAGLTNSYGNGGTDILLSQFDDPVLSDNSTGHASQPKTLIAGCFPNPFTYNVQIQVSIVAGDHGQIVITNQLGQVIRKYDDLNPGNQKITWDGKDENKHQVNAGIYFVSLYLEKRSTNNQINFQQIMERRTFLSSIGKCGLSLSLLSLFPSVLTSGQENKLPGSSAGDQEPIRHSCDEKMEFAEEWIQKFMTVLDENLDEQTRNKIMENNGKVCMTSYLKKSGHSIKPVTFEKFSEWVEKNPGDGSVRIEGRTIHYAYLTNYQGKPVSEGSCLCPLVESKPAGLSPTYCQCSVGYVREYFTQVLGQPVKVELTESVLRGGKFCRFRIEV